MNKSLFKFLFQPLTVTSSGTMVSPSVSMALSVGAEGTAKTSMTFAQLQQLGLLSSHMAPSTLLQVNKKFTVRNICCISLFGIAAVHVRYC